MNFGNIILEKRGGMGKIIINRPPLNIINLQTLSEITSALGELKQDPGVKVVIITGNGDRVFSAGVDIRDHLGDNMPKMVAEFGDLLQALREVDKPTIAVVNGVALGGGCELVAGCDMAIACEEAQFGQPEMSLAIYPGPAGVLLPRIVGRRKAFELIMTGQTITAKEAERIGLVNKVVPQDELEKMAEEMVGRILDKSRLVLGLARRAFYQALDIAEFEKAWEVTEELTCRILETADAFEGLTAYLEKRKPVWKDE